MISLGFSYPIAGRRLELSTKAIATEDLDDRSRWFLMDGVGLFGEHLKLENLFLFFACVDFWGVFVHVVQQETDTTFSFITVLRVTIWSQSQNCGKSQYIGCLMFDLFVLPKSDLQSRRGNNGWKPKFTTSNPLVSSLRLAPFIRIFGDETRGHVTENLIFISPVSRSKSAFQTPNQFTVYTTFLKFVQIIYWWVGRFTVALVWCSSWGWKVIETSRFR